VPRSRSALAGVPLLALVASGAALAGDWPGFLGPQRDARSAETGLVLRWPESGPPVRWQHAAGAGYAGPAIVAGKVFFHDRHGDRTRLVCLDAATGAERWRVEHPAAYEDMYGFGTGPRATPVVAGDLVFTFDPEGHLRCHGAADGRLVWEIDTARRYGVVQNFFGVGSTPVVEGDLLIVPIGGSPPGAPGIQSGEVRGNGTGLVAFDTKTGVERWRSTDELASYSSPIVADVGGRRLGLAFLRGGLVAFEPRTGKVAFRFPWRARKLESVNASNPAIAGDLVFITESYGPGGALLRVGADGYTLVRSDPPRERSLAAHWMTPVAEAGVLYGCHGESSGEAELRAVDVESGRVRWSQGGLGRTTLLHVDGHLIVLAEDGRLLVVRATPESYQPVSDVVLRDERGPLLRAPAWTPPALADGLLYVRGADRLVCLDLRRPAGSGS
jgi:outer membrane protein assembly factor BamB